MKQVRKCKTCGIPLWAAWLIMARPWQRRVRKFKDAEDCIHTMAVDWEKSIE